MNNDNQKHSQGNLDINEIRESINSIDNEIIKLLSQRRKLSLDVVRYKNSNSIAIRDEKREEELLVRLIQIGRDNNLDSYIITKVFHEIIDDSIKLQRQYIQDLLNDKKDQSQIVRVAFQGIEGAYSYLAGKKFFAADLDNLFLIGYQTFDEVIKSVEKGQADYAILPIENTTSGGINEVYDLLLHTQLSIVGEEKFAVKHCLVTAEDVKINEIKTIFSHPQAVAQCSNFLSSLPNCKIEYYTDTAMSVQKIKDEGLRFQAAIASVEAANMFGLKVLKTDIANQSDNITRFYIAARNPKQVDKRIPSKTSLVMSTSHQSGSLVETLLIFKEHELNLTKLESRPILGNPWEEMFYLDFEGNIADENVLEALDKLGRITKFFKILGSYPTQDLPRTKLPPEAFINQKQNSESSESDKKPIEKKSTSKKSYKLASREYKPEDTIINVKGILLGGNNFTVIAGPCSVESFDQIMVCAKEVKNNGAQILRGGCFKPRTSPYSFQGLGYEGLDYLFKAGREYELPIITEVLSPEDIVEVAKYSDIIQIGARNMQNFSLLKEAGKVHRPVMLKRGLMSSIDELLNAAEYILAQGNHQVILCERGIRTFETATRNTLDLSAVPILKELTHLPIIVDPSHAAGERDLVIPLAKASKAVGAHGIMVEFHPEPEKALSDGPQALYFSQFESLMSDLLNNRY